MMGQHVLGANVTLGRLESGLHGNWVHLWGDEWITSTGVIHCVFDQIPHLQNCFTM